MTTEIRQYDPLVGSLEPVGQDNPLYTQPAPGTYYTASNKVVPVLATVPGIAVNDATDAADVLGALFELKNVGRTPGGSFRINAAILYDYGNVGAALTLHLFTRPVTLAASDAAWALSDADSAFWIASVDFTVYKTNTNNQTSRVIPGIEDICDPSFTSLWGGVQSVAAYTLPTGANSPPQIRLIVEQD